MSDERIPLEGVKASDLKIGDTILGTGGYWKIVRIDVIHGCGTREFRMDRGMKHVMFDDDPVARILPEPVEVREFWRCSYEWKRATPDCRIEWAESVHTFRAKIDAEERLDRAIKTHANGREIRKQRIEHVRETILSREEVQP